MSKQKTKPDQLKSSLSVTKDGSLIEIPIDKIKSRFKGKSKIETLWYLAKMKFVLIRYNSLGRSVDRMFRKLESIEKKRMKLQKSFTKLEKNILGEE